MGSFIHEKQGANFKAFLFFLVLIVLCLMGDLVFAANAQVSKEGIEYAIVDTDPATAGYWTNPVYENGKGVIAFSVRGSGSMTVTLQFKCYGDSDWSDYPDGTYTTTTRILLYGNGAGVQWRAGVKDADYTSGEKSLGFDY